MSKPVEVAVQVRKSRIAGAATLKIVTPGGRQWSLFLDAEETQRVWGKLDTIIKQQEKSA